MVDKCKCGKDAVIDDLCDDCKMGADMNEDLQGLINRKRMKDFNKNKCPKCNKSVVMDRAVAHDLHMICGNKGEDGVKCKYVYTDQEAELILGVKKVDTVDNEGNQICAFVNVGNGHEYFHSWYCLKRFETGLQQRTHDKLYHKVGDKMAGSIPSGYVQDLELNCGMENVI